MTFYNTQGKCDGFSVPIEWAYHKRPQPKVSETRNNSSSSVEQGKIPESFLNSFNPLYQDSKKLIKYKTLKTDKICDNKKNNSQVDYFIKMFF